MNPDNTIATAPHTSVWICGTGPAQAAGGQQQQQNTAATVCTQYGCQPVTQHGGQQTGHQHQNTAATICTQYGCQPQQNANVSVPPHCPTVAPMCPPPAYGGQAQAQFPTWPPIQCTTGILTAVVGCAQQGQQAQQGGNQAMPPSIIGCPPTQQVMGCTTIAGLTHNPPMCPPPPANMGGQAQAQFPTWPIGQCTVGITVGVITAVAGCEQQGQQAQAQGSYYTMNCPAPQAQGQQQVMPHTIFPPVCNVGGGNTGAYTHLFGCTTVTSTPTTPSTHFPGCTGVTATPATGGYTHLMGCTTVTSTPHTHLMGCTTITSTPHTQAQAANNGWTAIPACTTYAAAPAQASDNGWTAVKACTTYAVAPAQAPNNGWTAIPACTTYAAAPAPMQGTVHIPNHGGQTGALPPTYHPAGGCGPAANANGGGQAQAQMPTIPTIPPTVCIATAAFNCGHITGIVFVC